MDSVLFQNQGLIDLRAIKTFGVSSKETSTPIGYFGTGLKYAIAILLREHQKITIYRGKTKLEFTVKKTKIRVDHFKIVCMNGEELGFTTELGKNWEIWQAFRELYCNCIDESQGQISLVSNPTEKSLRTPGHTTIRVQGRKFLEAYKERAAIILQSKPSIVTPKVEIHPGRTDHIYFRGIRVGRYQHQAVHTYNITGDLGLTEDRTAKFNWEVLSYITRAIMSSTNPVFICCCLKAPKGSMENRLSYSEHSWTPSDEFKEVALSLAKDYSQDMNRSAVSLCKNLVRKDLVESPSEVLSVVMDKQLTKAVSFCKKLGYLVDVYPIIVVDSLGKGILGLAESEKIFLAQDAFEMGTKIVAGTLIEEYLHLYKGFSDYSPEFQDHLLNKVLTLGEKLNGEPL